MRDEDQKKLFAAVVERIGAGRPCPLCGQVKWILADKFVALVGQSNPKNFALGGDFQPVIPLVCGHCGNTHLLNLMVLGFKELDIFAETANDAAPK